MRFCSKCENMYYIRLSSNGDDSLTYYCRNCGHEDSTSATANICVSKTVFKKGEQKYTESINQYTKLDPTLPRVTNIVCPNASCPSNIGDAKSEVIYNRYDDMNIKYVYMCAVCDKVWKTDEQK